MPASSAPGAGTPRHRCERVFPENANAPPPPTIVAYPTYPDPATVAGLLLATVACSQTSGRHFRRDSRLPPTPAASPVKDAAAHAGRLATLHKLRSGRPWPRHHFGRLPQPAAGPATQPVDAAHQTQPKKVRGFWRAR